MSESGPESQPDTTDIVGQETQKEEKFGDSEPQIEKIGDSQPQREEIQTPEGQNGKGEADETQNEKNEAPDVQNEEINGQEAEEIENGTKSENGDLDLAQDEDDIRQEIMERVKDESENDQKQESEDGEINGGDPLDDPPSQNDEAENAEDAPATLDMKDDFSNVILPVVPTELTEAVSNARTSEKKFAVLKKLSEAVEISDRDLVDTVFNLLVGGEFDLELNFIIKESECVMYMVDLLESCSVQCQAEIWSKFKGICRKSTRNLHACKEAGLLQSLLVILKDADDMIADKTSYTF